MNQCDRDQQRNAYGLAGDNGDAASITIYPHRSTSLFHTNSHSESFAVSASSQRRNPTPEPSLVRGSLRDANQRGVASANITPPTENANKGSAIHSPCSRRNALTEHPSRTRYSSLSTSSS